MKVFSVIFILANLVLMLTLSPLCVLPCNIIMFCVLFGVFFLFLFLASVFFRFFVLVLSHFFLYLLSFYSYEDSTQPWNYISFAIIFVGVCYFRSGCLIQQSQEYPLHTQTWPKSTASSTIVIVLLALIVLTVSSSFCLKLCY